MAVGDVKDAEANQRYRQDTQRHKYVGSYYGKSVKTLKEEGIITKEYGMWKLREDLQDKGIAVYVTGRMRCFYHFYLSWTPKGIEFIKEIINNRTRH